MLSDQNVNFFYRERKLFIYKVNENSFIITEKLINNYKAKLL
jgi:hypothetical protein